MITRTRLLFLLVLGLAVALTFLKVPLASSQGVTLVAARVSGELPTGDPDSALWQTASAVAVPLSAQTVTRPMLVETKVKSVTARALHNESQLALLVEWADETQDDAMIRVQDFRDAAAVQFPLAEGQPFFCMGQPGANVNVWHWKADWQADIAARQDMESQYPNMYVDQYPFTGAAEAVNVGAADYIDPNYLPALASGNLFASPARTTPVEDLIAGGFGSLTAQPASGQNVMGYGVWANGQWRVIFSRDLDSQEVDDVALKPGQVYFVAFAVWDGVNEERNGQKSTSQWLSLQLPGQAPPPTAGWTPPGLAEFLQMMAAVAGIAIVIWLMAGIVDRLGRRQRAP